MQFVVILTASTTFSVVSPQSSFPLTTLAKHCSETKLSHATERKNICLILACLQ